MLQTITYTGKRCLPLYPTGDNPPQGAVKLATGTYKAGQLVEESSTPGTYQALTAAANAQAIVQYDVVVDADGMHWLGAQASNEVGAGEISTPVWYPGGSLSFDTRDLSVDNAGGVITTAHLTALKAKLISGIAAAGIIQC